MTHSRLEDWKRIFAESSLMAWLLSRCVWAPPTGAVGDGGPQERHRALHRVHRPAPRRGHCDRSGVSVSGLQKEYVPANLNEPYVQNQPV